MNFDITKCDAVRFKLLLLLYKLGVGTSPAKVNSDDHWIIT